MGVNLKDLASRQASCHLWLPQTFFLLLLATAFIEAAPPQQQQPQQQLDLLQGRIISGRQASIGQFPWQVILKRDDWDDLLCGGSIISDLWVLTAGHCAYGKTSLYIVFGSIELNDDSAQSMTSTKLYVHPNYNDKMNNDVALVQLPQQLIFSSTVQPIQLVSRSQAANTYVGTQATIAGFGLIDDEYLDYSQTLLYAQVEIIANDKCLSSYGPSVVLSSTMCAEGSSGSNMSTCSGDSGGPMIIYNSSLGRWIQIGINSFVAEDRCTTGLPSGYVRLTSFIDYIAETTGLNLS